MAKNFYFVINDKEGYFELWVNGECITECLPLTVHSGETELMEQLVEFAGVPCYKKLNPDEIYKTLVND